MKVDDSCDVCGEARGFGHVHEVDQESLDEQLREERENR